MTSITVEKFLDSCQTGDILLYSTSLWYSKIIEKCTGSKYSHISIILRDPVYIDPKLKGLYILESGFERTPDPTDGKIKFGVQIKSLNEVLESYESSWLGTLYYRKLECTRDELFYEKLDKIYNIVYDKPYDINLCDWIKAAFKIDIGNEHKTNTFWCSALVAFIYCKMNLLENVPWTMVSPKEFSYYEDSNSLKFINCVLNKEQYIEF